MLDGVRDAVGNVAELCGRQQRGEGGDLCAGLRGRWSRLAIADLVGGDAVETVRVTSLSAEAERCLRGRRQQGGESAAVI